MLEIDPKLRRETIHDLLRREILSCALPPGATLYEGVLAERFGVSKSPIRDALSRLAAEGLVLVEPRKGYRVAPVSIADAAELFAFRSMLEPACAELTAALASDAGLADLDRFRSCAAWGGETGFVAYNHAFHTAVLDLCPNKRMGDVAKNLNDQFDRLVLTGLRGETDRNTDALVAEHAAIVDALQARDGRAAGRLLARHVERAEKRVMKALSSTSVVP